MTGLIILKPLDSIGYIAVNGSEHDNDRLLTDAYLRGAMCAFGSVNEGAAVHAYVDRSHKNEFVRHAGFEGFHVEEQC